MQRTMILAAIGAVALSGVLVTTSVSYAQTSGMERRGDRRDDREGARDEKRECKAGDEDSRAECRQDKRDTKQDDRHDGGDDDDAAKPEPAKPDEAKPEAAEASG